MLLNDESYRLVLLISVILGSSMIVKNVRPLIFKGNVQHDWNQNENLRESDAKISFWPRLLGSSRLSYRIVSHRRPDEFRRSMGYQYEGVSVLCQINCPPRTLYGSKGQRPFYGKN